MKFLSLLSAVLVSAALVSADSTVATGAQEGKVPQMLNLINKLEHANPTDPTFVAEYATDLPRLAALHHDVADQFGEKQVRKLYGDDEGADKLIELVKGVQQQKREVKEKKETKTHAAKDTKKANHGSEVSKHKQGEKQSAAHKHKQGEKEPAAHKKTKTNHGTEVNKHKQGEKQSAAHKKTHVSAGGEKKEPTTEVTKRAEEEKKTEKKPEEATHKKEAAHKKETAHKKEDEKKHAAKPTHKEHKKPAHKHKSKTSAKATSA